MHHMIVSQQFGFLTIMFYDGDARLNLFKCFISCNKLTTIKLCDTQTNIYFVREIASEIIVGQ